MEIINLLHFFTVVQFKLLIITTVHYLVTT